MITWSHDLASHMITWSYDLASHMITWSHDLAINQWTRRTESNMSAKGNKRTKQYHEGSSERDTHTLGTVCSTTTCSTHLILQIKYTILKLLITTLILYLVCCPYFLFLWKKTKVILLKGKIIISPPKTILVFNTTFYNISVISWQSALLVEKTTDLLTNFITYCCIQYIAPEQDLNSQL